MCEKLIGISYRSLFVNIFFINAFNHNYDVDFLLYGIEEMLFWIPNHKDRCFFSRDHYNHAEKKNFDIEPQDIAVFIELFGFACLFNTLT